MTITTPVVVAPLPVRLPRGGEPPFFQCRCTVCAGISIFPLILQVILLFSAALGTALHEHSQLRKWFTPLHRKMLLALLYTLNNFLQQKSFKFMLFLQTVENIDVAPPGVEYFRRRARTSKESRSRDDFGILQFDR